VIKELQFKNYNGLISYWWIINRHIGGIVGNNDNARLEYVNVYNTTIKITNPAATDNRAPYVGMVVGLLSSSVMWYVGASNVTLDPGALTTAQKVNFGATRWWAWGGNEQYTNDIR
jgi:hypothetical protein